MQIEAGKYYRTRDGAIAGPAEAKSYPGHDDWVWLIDTNDGGAYYRDDGSCPYLPEYDIIGEVSQVERAAPEMLELLARCRYYLGRNESSSAASLLCEIEVMIDRVTR